ncbi:MAG: metal ABC transporter substrate-binding protein [Candidatus Accumulibacter phosphatis]|uniref:metal ABC transporter substrate-binding protein n=1 Tax=Candidatus Accumulibacter sp. ACC012 TaxID=2823332 RepID=UPI0025B7D4D3|nr:metal ABC transporter substrate-binding protein [Candidatus Accumulibacter sp. ACC012]
MIVNNFVLGIAALLLSTAGLAADRIPVIASFSILGDLVSVVGGDRVAVSTLVGPDQDAHVFEPRPAGVKLVAQAKLFVVNGLGFEGWLDRLTRSADFKGVTVVASRGIQSRQMADEDHPSKLSSDPHAWQDPRNVIDYVRNIASALGEIDPAGAAYYQENSQHYVEALKLLDAWAAGQYATIPVAKRKLITSHDAFAYHAARYDIAFLAPQGVSTESEPSAKEMAKFIRQIKHEKIKAVFMENMSNPRLLEQLAKGADVIPSGKLYSDALSTADGPAPTYLKMMHYNVEQILSGLKQN